jgi:hypothetical protein
VAGLSAVPNGYEARVTRTPDPEARDAAASLAPYRDISGSRRAHDPWVRRGLLLVLALLVLAALLNRFGQEPMTSNAAAPAAALEVQSPDNLRGGLIFQARFTITAREHLARPTLILERGWFESMSVNSIVPDAAQQDTRGGRLRLTYPSLAAGSSRVVWIYFQVNPTNLGQRSQDVVLADGSRQLAAVRRSVTVWP